MRILYDARGIQQRSDGLTHYIRNVLFQLLDMGREHEYVVLLHPQFREELVSRGLAQRSNLALIVTPQPFMGLSQQVTIPFLARRLPGISLYHYPHFDMPLFAHPRSIVTVLDLNQFDFAGYFQSFGAAKRLYSYGTTHLSASRAAHVLTISHTTKQQLLRRFPWLNPSKVTVTPLGLNEAFRSTPSPEEINGFRQRHRLGADRFILYVGTDRPHKNLTRLLQAFRLLRTQSGVPHKLLLIGACNGGDGPRSLIHTLGLGEAVRCLGYVADDELPAAYRLAEVFAFCSLSEGFGLPLVEAMASGVPVLTSDRGAMAEVAGEAALLVDPTSVEAIAEGLRELVVSEGLRGTLIARGRERARAFTWAACARATLDVYARVGRGLRDGGQGIGPVPSAADAYNTNAPRVSIRSAFKSVASDQ